LKNGLPGKNFISILGIIFGCAGELDIVRREIIVM
jgi:hypothetical protein